MKKVSRRSYEDFVNLLTGQNVAPTTNLEYMLRIVGLEAEADGIKKDARRNSATSSSKTSCYEC